MRKFALIFVTVAVLGAAFVVYYFRQPVVVVNSGPAFGGGTSGAASEPSTPPAGLIIGKGNGVWVEQYDKDTGKRSYQFKADFYDPQPDGTTVHVIKPVAEFFQGDGQIIHVEGDDGDIRVAPGTDRAGLSHAPAEPPRYGTLHNVVVKVFNSAAKEALGEDDMTLTMTNAEFDNDTFRLFTEEYTDQGQVIRADQVPVDVMAKDYRFEGSGMVMYWNGLDKKLKSLDIYHAKKLTIFRAGALGIGEVSPSGEAKPVVTVQPQENGASTPVTTAPAVVQTSEPVTSGNGDSGAAKAGAGQGRYTATVLDDVEVWQGGQKKIQGEKMDLDFVPKGGSSPVPGATGSPAATAPSADATTNSGVASAPAAPAPNAPVNAEAGLPAMAANEPIEVYWKGMLHIVPTDERGAPPLEAGQSLVHLVGKPVQLHDVDATNQKETNATCAELTYRTADAGALLVGSAESPLILTQKRTDGSVTALSGHSLDFSRKNGVTTILGEGAARIPDPNDAKSILNAAWNKSCVVHFSSASGGQQELQNAELSGGVLVDHPRFRLTSNDLVLNFEPAPVQSSGPAAAAAAGTTSGTQLKELDATGDANCVVHEADGQKRSISGQRLRLQTDRAGGKLFAKTILADGGVNAVDDTQDLMAEHLNISLLPTAGKDLQSGAESVALDRLVATDSVKVKGNNGSSAEGDWLQTVMVNGQAQVTLLGQPAKVMGKNSTVTGQKILFSGVDQTSSVQGPGTLLTVQQPADATKKGRPILMKWDQGVNVDGKGNEIDVNGNVNVESKSEDGTVDSAHGESAVVMLMAKPTTQPSEVKKKEKAAQAGMGGMDFMGNKEVRSVSLKQGNGQDRAHLDSTLAGVDGKTLKRSQLFGAEIDYDTVVQQMTVPGKGELRTENHIPGADTEAAGNPMSSGSRGTSWIEWDKRMVYDEVKRVATIDGGVVVLHADDNLAKPRKLRMDSDRLVAEFEPMSGADAKAAAAATGTAGDAPQMQLNRVTAVGTVRVKSEDKTIHCGRVEFDPKQHLLKCFAGNDGIVTVESAQSPGGATFGEVWLDTLTNELVKMTDVTVRGAR